MPNPKNKCYACGKVATTREHVPPYCFFPTGYRENLITVPSCEEHNNKQSNEVEYVRNILSVHFSTNKLAREMSKGKVKRSFDYNPVLKKNTFKDLHPIILNGQKTGMFNVDLKRLEIIMRGIAAAIYFYQFQKIYSGSWGILIDSATSQEAIIEGKSDDYEIIRQMINKTNFKELRMPQPEVFRCLFHMENHHKLIYRFLFYGGLSICAVSLPFYLKPQTRE